MKKFSISFIFAALLVFGLSGEARAQGTPEPSISGGDVLCTSRLQLRHPGRCSNQSELTQLAVEGTYPERPIPATRIPSDLGDVPFAYLRSSNTKSTPVYTSMYDAINGEDPFRTVEPGFVFFSWIDRLEQDGKVVYMIAPGIYIRASSLSRISLPRFKGLAFNRTPERPFAWVLQGMNSYDGPGWDFPDNGSWLNRFEVVQIYETAQNGDRDWYRIGPDEWIEQTKIAMVDPVPTRPEGVPEDRWISINLFEQTISVYEDGELLFATMVSSGLSGWWTQPGVFQVYSKLENDKMQGAFTVDRSDFYYLEDVPWILYYDEARAIHGAYWHNGYGYRRSHGCVNLSTSDAHWIFDWAEEGSWVHVYDPSGETPTDPSTYGAGGA